MKKEQKYKTTRGKRDIVREKDNRSLLTIYVKLVDKFWMPQTLH